MGPVVERGGGTGDWVGHRGVGWVGWQGTRLLFLDFGDLSPALI
jgi:hypothetical protein